MEIINNNNNKKSLSFIIILWIINLMWITISPKVVLILFGFCLREFLLNPLGSYYFINKGYLTRLFFIILRVISQSEEKT